MLPKNKKILLIFDNCGCHKTPQVNNYIEKIYR